MWQEPLPPNTTTTIPKNSSLVSLVQSIMAEPPPPSPDAEDVKPDINTIMADANDVSSTHNNTSPLLSPKRDPDDVMIQVTETQLDAQPSRNSNEMTNVSTVPHHESIDATLDTQHDLSEEVTFAVVEATDAAAEPQHQQRSSTSSSSLSLSPPNNADYKSVLQVQQEALLGTSSASSSSLQHIANFEASSLASLLSTAAAADVNPSTDSSWLDLQQRSNALSGTSLELAVKKRSNASSSFDSSSSGSITQPTSTGATTTPAVAAAPAVKKPGSKRKNYPCRQGCGITFKSKEEYWMHNRMHIKADKALQCPACPFITEYKHHLEYHMRNHRAEKPFKCPECDYCCVNKSMLNSHLKSHSDIFLFKCAECTYATKYCHSLKLHLSKYKHKALPRANRKAEAARQRAANQRNAAAAAAGLNGEPPPPEDFDDDDDELDENSILIGGDDDEDNGDIRNDEEDAETARDIELNNFSSLTAATQQSLMSFSTPLRQMMPGQLQHPFDSQQQFDISTTELLRRRLVLPQSGADGDLNHQLAVPSLNTILSQQPIANGNIVRFTNGSNLVNLLNAVNINPPISNNMSGGLSASTPSSLITNRISFSGGGAHVASSQPNGTVAYQSSTSPSTVSSALANLTSAFSNGPSSQHQQRGMLNGNNIHFSQPMDVPAIMQLNNPILANALLQNNNNNKFLPSPPQQQTTSFLQQQQVVSPSSASGKQMQSKSLNKSSPPNISQLYSNYMLNGQNNNRFRDATPTDNTQQQQQMQNPMHQFLQLNSSNPAALMSTQTADFMLQNRLQNAGGGFVNSDNSAIQHMQNGGGGLMMPPMMMNGGIMMPNGSAMPFVQQQQPDLSTVSTSSSGFADLTSLLQNALVGRLSSALTQQQQQFNLNTSVASTTAATISALNLNFAKQQIDAGSNSGSTAPLSILATLNQLLNGKQQQSLLDNGQKPPNGSSSLAHGFDLTQALNALQASQKITASQNADNIAVSLNGNEGTALPSATNDDDDNTGNNVTVKQEEQQQQEGGGGGKSSSSSSTCSGSTATTHQTQSSSQQRQRKRKGQAFKLDSVLRKRLLLEVAEDEEEARREIFSAGNAEGQHSGAATTPPSSSSTGAIATEEKSEGGLKTGKRSISSTEQEQNATLNSSKKHFVLSQLRSTAARAKTPASTGDDESTTAQQGNDDDDKHNGAAWSNSYVCQHCGIAFLDCTMYTLHMGAHGLNNPFTCNSCGKITKDKIEFYLHLIRDPHHRQ